jgi:hypothetical protein
MIVSFTFSDYFISIAQSDLPGWNYRSKSVILSDILFFEGGFFLVFGAMLAGAVLFISWEPDRLGLFVEPVFRWKIIKKEREIPAALFLGIIIIIVGIVYISASIMITI